MMILMRILRNLRVIFAGNLLDRPVLALGMKACDRMGPPIGIQMWSDTGGQTLKYGQFA